MSRYKYIYICLDIYKYIYICLDIYIYFLNININIVKSN